MSRKQAVRAGMQAIDRGDQVRIVRVMTVRGFEYLVVAR